MAYSSAPYPEVRLREEADQMLIEHARNLRAARELPLKGDKDGSVLAAV